MRNYTELEQKLIDKEQSKLKKFKLSYYYLATGMEGVPDIMPEKIIEAPNKDMAVFIYHTMFFTAPTLKEMERSPATFKIKSYKEFLEEEEVYRYWGTYVEEIKKIMYCIEVQRSGEEDCVLHHEFDKEPTREEVLAFIEDEDMGYDDDYGRFEYYPV